MAVMNAMNTQNIFKSEMLFGSKMQSSVVVCISGHNIIAFLAKLDVLLDNINSAARLNDQVRLDELLGENIKAMPDIERLHKAVLNYVQNEGKEVLRTKSSCALDSLVSVAKGNICVSVKAKCALEQNTEIINTLADARKAMDELNNTALEVAGRRMGVSALYYAYDSVLSKVRGMEHSLAMRFDSITDIDMARKALLLAREEVLAKASMIVMAQGQHHISSVLALLRQ